MTMTSCAWIWMYAGAALMLLELLAPGFIIFFFGLAASTVGLMRFALGDTLTPTWQCIAFSAFSILYLAVIRRWLKSIFTGVKSVSGGDFDSDFIGRIGRVTTAIVPPAAGRIMLGDAEWDAKCDSPLDTGTEVRVTGQKNLTMIVERI